MRRERSRRAAAGGTAAGVELTVLGDDVGFSETEFLPLPPKAVQAQLSEPRRALARWGMAMVALLALAAAAFEAWHPGVSAASRGLALPLLALAVLAVPGALPGRMPVALPAPLIHLVFALAGVAAALFSATLGLGSAAPSIALQGPLCAMAAAVGGVWAATAVALPSLLAFLVLHVRPQELPFAAATQPPSGALGDVSLFMGVAAIAAGVAIGLALRRRMDAQAAAAGDREQRISGLLGLAVDAHWELDAQLRVTAINDPRDAQLTQWLRQVVGARPWDLPTFGCEPEVLDELRADLEGHTPFRDRPVFWRSRSGLLRHFMVSGEPRFDDGGQFRGYWGVAREVTTQVRVRAALAATESRYLELFSRIPSPLVLHRGASVIDANPAALRLFGHAELGDFIGRDLLDMHDGGDSRERARRRFEALDDMPAGEAAPVADFRLHTRDGRMLSVRAAAVRIDVPGGPATLSIFVDDTERRRADEAVRRSEALLTHLVDTSPDVITLTDLATGRYSMVNQTFERITGYAAAEVVGRTSFELNIWADVGERERFVAAIREKGSVKDMPCRFIAKSGAEVQLLVSGAVFAMDRRTYLVINGRDITAQERSRLERDAILENASLGIAVTRERNFVITNPRFTQMFGWDEGELIGQPGHTVWVDGADYAAVGEQLGPRLAAGELVEIEHRMRRRDGSLFLARMLAKGIDPTHPGKGGTIWICEDITERRQVAEALARARDEAEAANRAKSAFLANTSHELRTPLNGMLGLAQLARDPHLDAERRQQYLDQIVENAQALAAVVSDVLDFSKIEAGKMVLEQTSFDLGELLQSLRQAYSALAAGRGLALRFEHCSDCTGHARGDPLRVRQVLSNFLSNALKFTHSGEVRLLATRLSSERVRFEVYDNGPGIDTATQARLFRPFTQADESTTRRFGGTGLGLSIARELAHLMGGDVGVISQPGEGACFWAELNLPAVNSPPLAKPASAEQSLHGLRVLMVEDNPVNMLIGVALLQRWGADAAQAVDGQEAVDAVQQADAEGRPFDLVLMDVQMPVMSGHEATRRLRASAAGATLPIIALTAAALVTEREQALASGMNDFLTKPIDAERLRQALMRWAHRDAAAGAPVSEPHDR